MIEDQLFFFIMNISYIDRQTGQKCEEKIYKEAALRLLYGESWLPTRMQRWVLSLVKLPFFSSLYGFIQKRPSSAKKIIPFIQEFGVDAAEFLEPVSTFQSFNDFFIRRLKPEARPFPEDEQVAIMPADARYYFYQNIETCDGFIVKGQKFNLAELLQSTSLAQDYRQGSMVLARLCPSDYHRFHFPCDCLPGPTEGLAGALYSVNPLAIKKNIHIFSQNKRTLCKLQTSRFGQVLYMEVGATNVGSIRQTYVPNEWQKRGGEKGYFEFGGSSLILLFPPGSIQFDEDLLAATARGIEIRCLMGQSMGKN